MLETFQYSTKLHFIYFLRRMRRNIQTIYPMAIAITLKTIASEILSY